MKDGMKTVRYVWAAAVVALVVAVLPQRVEPQEAASQQINVNVAVAENWSIVLDDEELELSLDEPGLHSAEVEFTVQANFPYQVEAEVAERLSSIPGWQHTLSLQDGESGDAGEPSVWVLSISAEPEQPDGSYTIAGEYGGDITLRVVPKEDE